MQQKNKKRLHFFFLILYFGIVFFYLLVCLVPFLPPGKFWFIAVLGLIYPFLLALLIISLIVCILVRTKWVFLSLAALVLSWQQLSVLLALRTKKEFNTELNNKTLRVLSWNVSRWTESANSMKEKQGNSYRSLMMDAVQSENADVLCFQEFFECYAPDFFPANIPPLEKMGYQYHYFSPSSKIVNDLFQTGLIILSKYPIADTAFFKTVAGEHSEGFSYADIKFQNQTIRFFNTHLESIGMNREDYRDVGKTETARTIAGKIKRSYYLRAQQADHLRREMDRSPYPVVLCGDLDDVPNSYTYFKAKGNLQDAFLKKGSGLGSTFQFISPTLRIDYMMADKRLKVEQFKQPGYKYSDHYPLMMDISFK